MPRLPLMLTLSLNTPLPVSLCAERQRRATPRLEGNQTAKEQSVKTYSVIYAEDVPHYACGEIEARGPKEAIAKARALDTDTFGAYDPDWNNAVCRRIVSIEDDKGNDVARDISLDNYRLVHLPDDPLIKALVNARNTARGYLKPKH